MPRATKDPAVQVLEYFKSASLDACDLVLSLVKQTIHDRRSLTASTGNGQPTTPVRASRRVTPRPSPPVTQATATAPPQRRRRMVRPPINEATLLGGSQLPPLPLEGDADEGAEDLE